MVSLRYNIPSDDPSNGLIVSFTAISDRHDAKGVPVAEVIDYSRRLRGDATSVLPVLADLRYPLNGRKWCPTIEAARMWVASVCEAREVVGV
jgi:hypothetical protein